MWLLQKILKKLLHRGELSVTVPGGRVYRFGSPDPALEPVALRFHDRKVAGEIVRNARLAAAEAYMDGRLTFERGDILALLRLIGRNRSWEDYASGYSLKGERVARWKARLRPANRERQSRRNASHHYDIGNALYRLFLDEDMQYSCAYFRDPRNSLEQAQEDKKAHIAAKLHLKPGQRVLDIGCGWGGLALYLNRHYGVEVLGVTLADEQLALARERAAAAGVGEKVRFELLDYRKVEGQFDRIVSIGMFEHVGAEHYETFFAKCRSLLKPDGVMLLHTIGRFDRPDFGDPFAVKYIFPGYHLPSLSQLIRGSESAPLIPTDVETLRLHYAYTLQHWLDRTRAKREEIVALYDERFLRMWEVYLAGAQVMFETGGGCVYQVQYARSRHALPITRDYITEEEARLRSSAA